MIGDIKPIASLIVSDFFFLFWDDGVGKKVPKYIQH